MLAAAQNMTIEDIMAMTEMDGWEYTGEEATKGRDGLSYVCSAYVAAMFKAGGLFDDLSVQATEFAPKDIYILNFFDTEQVRPDACVAADPDLPYCQLLGKYRMKLPEFSTIDPYDHMFENCAINWPSYTREAGC